MPNLDKFVDHLNQKFPASTLKELAAHFSFIDADLPERVGQTYRAAGYLTRHQVTKIVDWKTSGRQRENFRISNGDGSVKLVTAFAAQAAKKLQDTPDIAASILLALRAVHFATASAILTAWNPNDYGILDVRSWSALRILTGDETFNRGGRTLFTAEEFRLYTLLLRCWRDRTGIPPRTIDKALWQFDKGHAQND